MTNSVSATSVHKSSGGGSNMRVVLPSGSMRDAISTGTASIRQFYIAPNNKLYVEFNSVTDFGYTSCYLAQVYKSDGTATCIEPTYPISGRSGDNWVQFDEQGNIYYSVTKGFATGLRRYSNGITTDYLNQYQSYSNWLVLRNGDVLIAGYTSANGLSWTRRVTTTGAVSTVSAAATRWMMFFPDGNVYFEETNCIRKFNVATSEVDPLAWGGSCQIKSRSTEFVQSVFLNKFWITANGRVLAMYSDSAVYYLFPTVTKAKQPLSRVTYGIPALTSMILVGVNASGKNQMVLFDASLNSATMLADGTNEIEFYHVRWVIGQNRVYFDGLRFADNKYVVGYLDLGSKALVTSDLLGRLIDFQSFT